MSDVASTIRDRAPVGVVVQDAPGEGYGDFVLLTVEERDGLVAALDGAALLGYVVLEPQPLGGFDLMLGTPMFEDDDRESAEACLAGGAFLAEVRRVPEEASCG